MPDVVAGGLRLLVCGINPGLWSAWSGHHFAGPGNRFWPALRLAGLTPRVLARWEEERLLEHGVGVTNMVARATATAAELAPAEVREGRRRLEGLVAHHRPRAVAVMGVGAYRTAFGDRRAALGRQERDIGGAPAWVLPNPSGLQARYGLETIADLLRQASEEGGSPVPRRPGRSG